MADLRIYHAEDKAAAECPAEPLDGTLKAAQAYVDSITRSAWWRNTCPPSFLGDHRLDSKRHGFWDVSKPPARVIVYKGRVGGRAWGKTMFPYRGRHYPKMTLGVHAFHGGTPAIADPWIILHELAHIMSGGDEGPGGHAENFMYRYLELVTRWLGEEHAACLRRKIKEEGIRTKAPLFGA